MGAFCHASPASAPPFSIAPLLQAWVSWAQFEKRMERLADQSMARSDKTREVLQRGLTLNPSSAALCQVILSGHIQFCGFLDLGAGHPCCGIWQKGTWQDALCSRHNH